MAELPSHVWPATTRRDKDGVVTIGGVPVTELAETYGTPLFILDEDEFRGRCRAAAAAFGGAANVHYASKAFLSLTVVRWIDEEGLSLDVASGGELVVALRGGLDPQRITLHGNNKSTEELRLAVLAGGDDGCSGPGVGHIVVDSFEEIERLNAIAGEHGRVQDVFVRLTVGVEAHTHEFIATAHEDQKFGFSVAPGSAAPVLAEEPRAAGAEGDNARRADACFGAPCGNATAASTTAASTTRSAADEAIDRVLASDHLRLTGLHSHIGSQIFEPDGFELAARRVLNVLTGVIERHGAERTAQIDTIDLGGGLGISYVPEDDPPALADLARSLRAIVASEATALGLPVPRLMVEPGRAIAGPAMVTLYTVGTIKDVTLSGGLLRRYVSVDGGMSDNIRTSLYDADYDCRVLNRLATGEPVVSRIVGKHCESGDVIVRDTWQPSDLAARDLLGVAATGAYCYSMSSRYNMLTRPAVVVVSDGTHRLILRRETLDDLLSLEVHP